MAQVSDEHPQIRNDIIDDLFKELNNKTVEYLHKHPDMTNEELHMVFYRLDQLRILQPSIQLFMMYMMDTRREDSENNAKNMHQYK